MGQMDIFDTTNELLDKYARKYRLKSDYAIAKHLGCSANTVRNYRLHKTKMDPTTCVQIAEALRIDPMLIIAKINVERSDNPRVNQVWGKYAGRAFFLAATISAFLASYDSAIAQKPHMVEGHHIHYAHLFAQIRTRLRSIFNTFLERHRLVNPSKKAYENGLSTLYAT